MSFPPPASTLPDPLASIPDVLTAGETVTWYQAADSEFAPGGGYGLTVYLRGPSKADLAGADDAGQWLVTLGAAVSGALVPGTYAWIAYATAGSERYKVDGGTVTLLPNLVTAAAGDRVSHAAKALALVEAQLEELLASPLESYTVGQRQATRRKIAELTATRNRYRAEVARERNDGRVPGVTFSFGRAG